MYNLCKKEEKAHPHGCAFSGMDDCPPRKSYICPSYILRTSYICTSYLAVVLLIVRLFLQLPEEGLHGLFAVRGVLLSCESGLVGGDLHQVFRTSCYRCCDCRETVSDTSLLRGHRGSTFVHFCITDEETGAVRVLSRSLAVSTRQVGSVVP